MELSFRGQYAIFLLYQLLVRIVCIQPAWVVMVLPSIVERISKLPDDVHYFSKSFVDNFNIFYQQRRVCFKFHPSREVEWLFIAVARSKNDVWIFNADN